MDCVIAGALASAKADINVIDFENLHLDTLHMVHDLPTGAPRLMQKARGYISTLVSGVEVTSNGEDTGARPGRLIRGRSA